jgi:hypothetical protein
MKAPRPSVLRAELLVIGTTAAYPLPVSVASVAATAAARIVRGVRFMRVLSGEVKAK